MVKLLKDYGLMIKYKDWVLVNLPMETLMKETGMMIKEMDMEIMYGVIKMNIKEIG